MLVTEFRAKHIDGLANNLKLFDKAKENYGVTFDFLQIETIFIVKNDVDGRKYVPEPAFVVNSFSHRSVFYLCPHFLLQMIEYTHLQQDRLCGSAIGLIGMIF